MVKGKSTMGRQRIEIKRIQKEAKRQVSFAKRRPSLFKKASELSTLCGAEVAVVTFSPGGKCLSFGHPSTLSVADRFLAERTLDGHTIRTGSHGGTQGLTARSHEMNQQIMELQQSMEAENKRKERVLEALEMASGGAIMQLLDANVSELGINELEELRMELCKVHDMVKQRDLQTLQDATQTRRLPPQPSMHMAAMPSQGLFADQRPGTMYTTAPSSSNGPYEGLPVNSLTHGSLGGIDNYLNGQFGG